jgi:hypothetical protein
MEGIAVPVPGRLPVTAVTFADPTDGPSNSTPGNAFRMNITAATLVP